MSLGAKFWSHWIGSGARRSRLVLKSWKTDGEYVASQGDSSVDSGSRSKTDVDEMDIKVDSEDPDHSMPVSAMESFKSVIMRLCGKWHRRFSSLWVNVKHLLWSISQLRVTKNTTLLFSLHVALFCYLLNSFPVIILSCQLHSMLALHLFLKIQSWFAGV